MPTAMTSLVSVHLAASELDRIVSAADLMRRDGMPAEEVKRWVKAEVGKAVSVK
jgi:hypothetical protein